MLVKRLCSSTTFAVLRQDCANLGHFFCKCLIINESFPKSIRSAINFLKALTINYLADKLQVDAFSRQAHAIGSGGQVLESYREAQGKPRPACYRQAPHGGLALGYKCPNTLERAQRHRQSRREGLYGHGTVRE